LEVELRGALIHVGELEKDLISVVLLRSLGGFGEGASAYELVGKAGDSIFYYAVVLLVIA
jgi:hypothetical protein